MTLRVDRTMSTNPGGSLASLIVYGLERFFGQDAGRAVGPLMRTEVGTDERPVAGPGDGSEKE
jgi:hypothetical protein